jgi:hypothetical protein
VRMLRPNGPWETQPWHDQPARAGHGHKIKKLNADS